MTNHKIAAAVAIALGTGGVAHAVAPTLTQCQAPQHQVFIGGSSAAQGAFWADANLNFFASGGSLYKSSVGNFQALCGISANASIAPVGDSVLIHYRGEGGSVVGALPLADGGSHPLNFLLTSGATAVGTLAAPVTLTVTGSSATVGTTDGWGGGNLVKHTVDIGITDVEPGQFVGANFPSLYSAAVFGGGTSKQMAALNIRAKPLVDQVFGMFVNTIGLNGGGSGQAINLSEESVASILDGTITDWSLVPTVTGGQVSTSAATISLINRESGSGSRAQASIYFLDYNCSGPSQTPRLISDPFPTADGYATGDVLAAASSTPGAITYASIDNTGKANLTLASLHTVAPSNLAATSGDYGDWYEAQTIKGVFSDAPTTGVYNYMINTLPQVAHAPQVKDILAIPNAGSPGNVSAVPVVAVGATPIYINPYGRSSNSCNLPKKQ